MSLNILIPLITITLISLIVFMFGKLTRKIALRNIFRRKGQTALVVLGSMVGTALIMGSFAINDTFNRVNLSRAYENLGEVDFVFSYSGETPEFNPPDPPGVESGSLQSVTNPHAFAQVQQEYEQQLQEAQANYQKQLLQKDYFTNEFLLQVEESISEEEFDGLLPIINTTIPASDYDYVNDRLTLINSSSSIIAVDADDLELFGSEDAGNISLLRDTPSGEVLVTTNLAESLELGEGDTIHLYFSGVRKEFRINTISELDGLNGFAGNASVIMHYSDFITANGWEQDVESSRIYTHLLISSQGDLFSGDDRYEEDNEILSDILLTVNEPYNTNENIGYSLDDVKHDAIEDSSGSVVASLFISVSVFSIAAGVLLIINIYLLLAEERKKELGIMRSLGMTRRTLIATLFKEGILYSLLSTTVGIGVGYLLGYFIINGFGSAINRVSEIAVAPISGFEFNYTVTIQSILISFASGYLLTLVTVLFASTRISFLNIIRAIRNIPEPSREKVAWWKKGCITFLFLGTFGLSLGLWSIDSDELRAPVLLAAPTVIGTLLVWLLISINRKLFNTRLLISLLAVASIGWGLYALEQIDLIKEVNEEGSIPVLVIFALLLIVGAIFFVVQNFEIITWVLVQTIGRLPFIKTVIKIATRYPALARTSSGLTITMFSLVLFLVVAITVNVNMFGSQAQLERDEVAGGYDGFVAFSAQDDIPDFQTRIQSSEFVENEIIDTDNIFTLRQATSHFKFTEEQIEQYKNAGVSEFVSEARSRQNQGARPEDMSVEEEVSGQIIVTFISESGSNPFAQTLRTRSSEYASDVDVYQAVANDPSLAILGSMFDTTNAGNFLFWPEVTVGDTIGIVSADGRVSEKTVVGIVEQTVSPVRADFIGDIAISDQERNEYAPIWAYYLFNTKENADESKLLRDLQKEFGINNGGAIVFNTIFETLLGVLDSIIQIFEAFLAFGLIIGVAGLAIIAYRTVFERRQQIGMVRALGFNRSHILVSFIIEFSYISLLGILIGVGMGSLGMWIAFPEIEGLEFMLPWNEILTISGGVYLSSILFVLWPATIAARLKPVEALRYES